MDEWKKFIGANIRRQLEKSERSQVELATYLHVDTGQVSRWVNGVTFPYKYLEKIALFCECSPRDFFYDDGAIKDEIGELRAKIKRLNEKVRLYEMFHAALEENVRLKKGGRGND